MEDRGQRIRARVLFTFPYLRSKKTSFPTSGLKKPLFGPVAPARFLGFSYRQIFRTGILFRTASTQNSGTK